MKKPIKSFWIIGVFVPCVLILCLACISGAGVDIPETKIPTDTCIQGAISDDHGIETTPIALPVETELLSAPGSTLTKEEIDLIALVTMAEAEGECEEGKRLVIDTILNRMDHKCFPNTVYEVIYQPNHFTPMWNGRIDRCEVRDDIVQLVLEELESRTNYDVIFFTAGGYSKYGVPLFQVEHHYFSSYD